MYQPRKVRLTASVILCFLLQAQGADKYTDENRPYEFGFKIDGQQHRHESKDKDGIIMGEFGFITADDVYHVTVYATDKEGRFKILSMKNIHLKSSPASNPRSPITSRQGHALALPPAPPASVQAATVPQPEKPFQPLEPPGKSCSSCSLPTTTTQSPPPVYNQANANGNYNNPGQFDTPGSNHQKTFPISSAGQPNNLQAGLGGSSFPESGQPDYSQQGPAVSQNYPQQASGTPYRPSNSVQQSGPLAQNYPSSPSYTQGPSAPNPPNNYAQPEISSQFGQSSEDAGPQPGSPQAYPGAQNTLSGGDNSPYAQSGPYGPAGSQNGLLGSNSQGGLSGPNSQGGLSGINSQGGLSGPNSRGGLSGANVQLPGGSSYPQGAGGRTSKQYNGPEQQFNSNVGPYGPQSPGSAPGAQPASAKPTLVSAQMQIVDKNTDIHSLSPGEKEGLPPGLTKNDMTQLLYTFNYTVGFHGHFEQGYTNGVKQGYYYVTGRNGVRTRIDYVADDTGFHPKVSQDVLDLLSDDVPKPETEKDAKFGLKGYEFKWLYYPVDS